MNTSLTNYNFIIVGAGIAGLSAIKKIREYNTKDRILLIHNEDRLPYKRTKINKHIDQGFDKDDFCLESIEWYHENMIDICYDDATQINKALKNIETRNKTYSYYKLLIANGSQPNIPEIIGLNTISFDHVHFAFEVETLINSIQNKQYILIIGGSIEGIETAYQLVKMGKQVSIVQRSENPLKQFFPEEISNHIYKCLKDSNVDYFDNETIQSVVSIGQEFQILTTNRTIIADHIIVCSGSKPNLDLASKAGLSTNKGILINELMQTSDENIFAAGDVAEHKNGIITGLWHPAEYQGYCAGANMCDQNTTYIEAPYRLKMEVFNNFYFSANYQKMKILKTKSSVTKEGDFYREVYLENDKIEGLIIMNDKKNSKLYQKAIAEKWTMDELNRIIPINNPKQN